MIFLSPPVGLWKLQHELHKSHSDVMVLHGTSRSGLEHKHEISKLGTDIASTRADHTALQLVREWVIMNSLIF